MSKWTVDTMREDLLARIAAQREHAEDRLIAHEREDWERHRASQAALEKAAIAIDRRLEAMNEFREQLSDQASRFVTRNEYDTKHEALIERIGVVADSTQVADANLTSRVDRIEARSGGLNAGWGYLVGAIGAMSSVIAIVYAVHH